VTAPSSSTSALDLSDLHEQQVALARQHAVLACEHFLRDEATGAPVKLQPFQEHWHQLIDRHPRVVIHAFVESGKTSALTVGRSIVEQARNVNLRGAIVSNTGHQAQRILFSVARYITQSGPLRELYPHLQADVPWHGSAIYVKRKTLSKDPSMQALGVHGNVLGARLDWLVLDDVLDYENTRTPEARADLLHWYKATLASRLTTDARVVIVGSAWHPEDLMHVLGAEPGWRYARTAIIDANGVSAWPSRWPTSRIEQRRTELGGLEFARQGLCLARDDASARFQRAWLDAALERGADLMPSRLWTPQGSWRTYTGVDLGISQKPGADLTSFATIAVDPSGNRRLLCVETGRMTADLIIAKIVEHHRRYGCQSIMVENVAAQDFIIQLVRKASAVPIRGFKTAGGAMSLPYAAEQLAVEFSNGKWVIPRTSIAGKTDPEIEQLLSEILYYAPTAHCGDRLASLLMAVHGAKQGSMRIESGRINLMGR